MTFCFRRQLKLFYVGEVWEGVARKQLMLKGMMGGDEVKPVQGNRQKSDQQDDVLLCLTAAGIRARLRIYNLIIRCFVCSHVPEKSKAVFSTCHVLVWPTASVSMRLLCPRPKPYLSLPSIKHFCLVFFVSVSNLLKSQDLDQL